MTKAQQARKARLLPNGVPRWIRVYDNDGRSLDCYTVVFTGRYTHKTGGEHWVLGMNAVPFHPQMGIGMHSTYRTVVDAPTGWPVAIGRRCHLGKRIRFEDLPEACQKVVMQDYVYLWDLEDEV